ncbi:MAG TPA: PorP/SprF family type IX secretion system membrane protein [Chitinophagaceae bacterium]|jgi:type IX secretion system PorP/SprF family membrane protein|nr:PorP/SprF family type IX secretion system membrane protein [Chitinophagaceae bacterium]
MKNLIRSFILCCCFLRLSTAVLAQDVHFSQFYQAPLHRNPALAGLLHGDVRVQAVHRSQWNSVSAGYQTTSLNGEYKMPIGQGDDFLTLGLRLLNDQAGTSRLTTTQVLPVLNFHKALSADRNSYLSIGFSGGYVQRRFDRSRITTNSQYEGTGDGEEVNNGNAFAYADGAIGASYNARFGESPENNYFIGAAYHHFHRPRHTFFSGTGRQLDPRLVFSGGLRFGVTETTVLTLEADHTRQGAYTETVGGFLYGLKIGSDFEDPDYTLSGGLFLRWNDALIPTLKLDYHPFSVSLSYDVNLSPLRTASGGQGGFELGLLYAGFLPRDNSSLNAVRCPRY